MLLASVAQERPLCWPLSAGRRFACNGFSRSAAFGSGGLPAADRRKQGASATLPRTPLACCLPGR
jgi:hypothetical protein